MVDAKTTGRWYFVIAMGRKAGHLALGMGKAAGATLTLIPEEFSQGSESAEVSIDQLVDVLAGAIIKRASEGRRDGVAVIAEGVCLLAKSAGATAEVRPACSGQAAPIMDAINGKSMAARGH